MEISVKRKKNNTQYPHKATKESAAFDVYCTGITKINERQYICHTDLYMRLPEDYRMCLVPRSSLTKYNYVFGNHFGIGDRDYDGEYQFRFTAIPTGIKFNWKKFKFENTYDEFPYKIGDRIGQIFLERIVKTNFKIVPSLRKLENNDRKGGFGSTGK